MKLQPNPDDIRKTVDAWYPDGQVFECRIPKSDSGTIAGYFDDKEAAVEELLQQRSDYPGTYISLNPVAPALLARTNNHLVSYVKTGETTSDSDILHRARLLIDCDPRRPAGISATEDEHVAAIAKADEIRYVLGEEGWPQPFVGITGNGAALIYRIDLPNDEYSTRLVKHVLKVLADRFDDDVVQVDQAVFNASRIVKLFGTWACKGADTPERPHRISKVCYIPTTTETVPQALLEVLAGPMETPRSSSSGGSHSSSFNIESFIANYLKAREPVPYGGGRKWVLEACPFNPDHRAPDAAVFEVDSGALGFRCLHNSCRDKSWKTLRDLYEPRQPTNGAPKPPGYPPVNGKGKTTAPDDSATNTNVVPWPEPIGKAGTYGIAGEFVRLVQEHTEGDPNILLLAFLAYAGHYMGRAFYATAGADKHCGNLYLAVVGTTGHGRKGSALSVVESFFTRGINAPGLGHVLPGISSGEGLVWQIRDPIIQRKKSKDSNVIEEEVVDEGIDDKRLIIVLGEFYQCLANMRRKENILSAILRSAWDGTRDLHTPTKNKETRATGAHLSMVACISKDELGRAIDTGDADNGTLNRFLWACSKRSRLLPEGGRFSELIESPAWLDLQARFTENAANVLLGQEHRLVRTYEACAVWGFDHTPEAGVYSKLTEQRTGMWGAITARAAPQVLRLSVIQAVINGNHSHIEKVHQEAALEAWRYCQESARYIFENRLDDPDAEVLIKVLRGAGQEGMTRTEITNHFQRHKTSGQITHGLEWLGKAGMARCQKENGTGGRASERWFSL